MPAKDTCLTAVDPAAQLASLIRVQVASLRRQAARKAPGERDVSSQAAANDDPAPDLAGVVAQRIRTIAPTDPQRERKAFRMFLETVLLSELGQQLVNDPSFASMVDHVQAQMENDPDLARAAREAAQLLLRNAAA
jgi:hypothetical protein